MSFTGSRDDASYNRCLQRADFPRFYERFLKACPEAASMFANTDFDRQERLLRHAIGLLLSVHQDAQDHPNVLTRIAERHSRNDLDVAPALYEAFVDSIIEAAAEFDPQFTPEIERGWRAAIAPGIAYMKRTYDAPSAPE